MKTVWFIILAGVFLLVMGIPEAAAGLPERTDDGGMRAALLLDGREAFDARMRLIAGAEQTLELGTYLFKDDMSGRLIASALMAAADRGVRVRILSDGLIGRLNGGDLRYVLGSHQNMEFRFYNPVNLLDQNSLNSRYHEKFLIKDREVLVLGGRNISDDFLSAPGHPEANYDLDVLVFGTHCDEKPAAQALAAYFDLIWEEHCAPAYSSVPESKALAVSALAEELGGLYAAFCLENPELIVKTGWAGDTVPVKGYTLLVNPARPGVKEPMLWEALTDTMKNAGERIWVLTPYLVLDDRMTGDLKDVAALVPDMTVLINSREVGRNLIASADYLVRKGMFEDMRLRLYEFHGNMSMHTKAVLFDGDAGAVGTFNFDLRSVYINTEVMLILYGEEFNAMLEQYMRGMLAFSSPANAAAREDETRREEIKPPVNVRELIIHFLAPFITALRPLI